MPGAENERVVTVTAGTGRPDKMRLPRGETIGPLSIGRQGTFCVQAANVLAEHGYLYFNGNELFLQSVDPARPVMVNGHPIAREWTPVHAPSEIAMGDARLHFGEAAPKAAPSAPPPPTATFPKERPFAPGAFASNNDEDATRLQPIEELLAAERARKGGSTENTTVPQTGPSFSAPIPAAGRPASASGPAAPSFGAPPAAGSAPSFGPPPAAGSGPGFGAPPAAGAGPSFGPPPAAGSAPGFGAPPPGGATPSFGPPPAAAPGATKPEPAKGSLAARWREASGPQKALLILLLPLLGAVWIIFTDAPPPPRAPESAPSASASASAAPSAPSASASAESGAVVEAPSGDAAPAATVNAATGKTAEREAADAVAAGDFARAAKLYEALAKENPNKKAYAEAARILRARSKR